MNAIVLVLADKQISYCRLTKLSAVRILVPFGLSNGRNILVGGAPLRRVSIGRISCALSVPIIGYITINRSALLAFT